MRRLAASLPWLLLAVAVAALWRVAPPAEKPLPPVVETRASVALAAVTLPPPPPMPAAAPTPPPPPVPKVAPLRPAPPPVAKPVVVPLRPKPEPRPKPAPPQARPEPAPEENGRALLVLLEHGRGPRIAIDWPGGAADRRLADRLARCHGMQVALLDGEGRLWREADPAGTPWQVNRDRYSGFLRVGAGDPARTARIRQRHRTSGEPARLFPRAVDAGLLAELGRLVGPRYAEARDIRLRYRLRGGAVVLDGVRVDGDSVAGQIALPRDGRCRA